MKQTANHTIGILGGTFDPIHLGHVRAAQEVLRQLPLQEIRFIPCQIPVHKAATIATPSQRLTMLQLALDGMPQCKVDDRELQRVTPSYTHETLLSLHAEFPQQNFCLILGIDAFAQFTSWHRWQELLRLANIIVVTRHGYQIDATHPSYELFKRYQTANMQQVMQQPCETILQLEINGLDISSSQIRTLRQKNQSINHLVPEPVAAYIEQYHLYQPHI